MCSPGEVGHVGPLGKTKSTVKVGSWSAGKPTSRRSDNRTLFCQNQQEVTFEEPVKRYSWRGTLTVSLVSLTHAMLRDPASFARTHNGLRQELLAKACPILRSSQWKLLLLACPCCWNYKTCAQVLWCLDHHVQHQWSAEAIRRAQTELVGLHRATGHCSMGLPKQLPPVCSLVESPVSFGGCKNM